MRKPFAARGLFGAVALGGLAVLLSSCGERRKPVFPVEGRVVDANDKSAVGALVIFHPAGADSKDPHRPLGKVGEDGRFALTTYKEGDGAAAGEYVITLTWPAPRKTPFEPDPGDLLKGRYAAPERSTQRFTVEKKPDNEVPTIRLQ